MGTREAERHPFADGWRVSLLTLPDVVRGGVIRFHTGLTSRTSMIPLTLLNLQKETLDL